MLWDAKKKYPPDDALLFVHAGFGDEVEPECPFSSDARLVYALHQAAGTPLSILWGLRLKKLPPVGRRLCTPVLTHPSPSASAHGYVRTYVYWIIRQIPLIPPHETARVSFWRISSLKESSFNCYDIRTENHKRSKQKVFCAPSPTQHPSSESGHSGKCIITTLSSLRIYTTSWWGRFRVCRVPENRFFFTIICVNI